LAILIKYFSYIVSLFPHSFLEKICSSLGYLLIRLPNPRRRVLLSNLTHAFPYWSKKDLYKSAQESAARMFEMGFFSLTYPFMDMESRKRTVTIDAQTQSLLRDLSLKETPVLFLLPHICLFETLATSPFFRPCEPKKLGAIYRPNRNTCLNDWIANARLATGIKLFSRKDGLRKALYFLRRGNWLTVLFDQNGGQSGSDAIFLNRVTSLTTFPDLLAKVENLRVFYAFPKRVKFFQTTLTLKEISSTDGKSISVKAHDFLADQILKAERGLPEWLWSHGKWKIHFYPEVRFRLNQKKSFLLRDGVKHLGTRIVIRLPNWLGDVVMALPIIRALRLARPDMYFLIMGNSAYLSLFKKLCLGEEFISIARKNSLTKQAMQLIKVREKMPECHLLFTNSLRGDIESLVVGSPQRFGLEFAGKSRPFLTNSLKVSTTDFNSRHLTKTWEQMIQAFGFLGKVTYEPFLLHSSTTKKSVFKIGIALGSSNNPAKRWPTKYYIQLIHLICEYQSDICITLYGTKSDFLESRKILEASVNLPLKNLVGTTSVVQLAEEFSGCSLVIGCDSGAVHLANAVGIHTLTIFGPTNHQVTSPCFDVIREELVPNVENHSMDDWSSVEVFNKFKSLYTLIGL